MAALDFPTAPSVNDVYTSNGKSWQWDGTSWVSKTAGVTPTISVGTTAPASPATNDIWIDTN